MLKARACGSTQRRLLLSYQSRFSARQVPFFDTKLDISPPREASQQSFHSQSSFRKQGKELKDDYKVQRREKQLHKAQASSSDYCSKLARWDLTVGLEIHAQLNTRRKLFSESPALANDTPNSSVSFYDLAFPGSQPIFQVESLIPALRAALALNCNIQTESRFDRKHYFYPDQPAGYQITQYYRPFAIDGCVCILETDLDRVTDKPTVVGIKQVQLEQDTAKSIVGPPSPTLVDFNRVGHPLIEIITNPDLHSPEVAAACARKIMAILQSVNAVSTGMELGGLRADVNVSICPKGSGQLGQRTEIKNVSSFKAIEQAIVAERDRQIELLESGARIESETRGWTLGETQTTRLRGKEGEVDYRYMPDPDVPPLLIDKVCRALLSALITQADWSTGFDRLRSQSATTDPRSNYNRSGLEIWTYLERCQNID